MMKNKQMLNTENEFIQEMIQKTINESMTQAIEFMMNQLMLAQRQEFVGVGPYERSDERDGYANGFKPLNVKTGSGKLKLAIPQVLLGLQF